MSSGDANTYKDKGSLFNLVVAKLDFLSADYEIRAFGKIQKVLFAKQQRVFLVLTRPNQNYAGANGLLEGKWYDSMNNESTIIIDEYSDLKRLGDFGNFF